MNLFFFLFQVENELKKNKNCRFLGLPHLARPNGPEGHAPGRPKSQRRSPDPNPGRLTGRTKNQRRANTDRSVETAGGSPSPLFVIWKERPRLWRRRLCPHGETVQRKGVAWVSIWCIKVDEAVSVLYCIKMCLCS